MHENMKHPTTVPRCSGRVLMAEELNVSSNAVAITYSRVNEQHLEVPFVLFCFDTAFFSYGAGILSVPLRTLKILLLKKNILYCIV